MAENAHPEKPDTSMYRPFYCEELINHMAQGKSYITWGPLQRPRISVSAQYAWEQKYPAWKEAKQTGYALGLHFYETLLRSITLGVESPELKKMKSKGVNLHAVLFTLRTRFYKEYGDAQKHIDKSGDKEQNSGIVIEFVNSSLPVVAEPKDDSTAIVPINED